MSIYGSYYFVTIAIDNDMVLLVAWNSNMDVMSILKHIRTPLQKYIYKHVENDVITCINIQG
jgi:ADP-dependent phosphofructokinase/glucokinase